MQNTIHHKIYRATVGYCENEGLIKKLRKNLMIPEVNRFSNINIDKDGLSVLDAVHCLIDKGRTEAFIDEINKNTSHDKIVIEAGLGTGILSLVSSVKSRYVYAFEINSTIYRLACKVRSSLLKHKLIGQNIKFIHGDARSYRLPFKADIVISENLYTGMFFEKQIEIVKSLRKNLKKGGVFIPSGMKSYIYLCSSNFDKVSNVGNLYVVSEMSSKPRYLSGRVIYDSIFFSNVKRKGVNSTLNFNIKSSGKLNSIMICSEVMLPSGAIIGRSDTEFMNNDIIIPFKKTIDVKRGDVFTVTVSYLYGSDPSNVRLLIKKLVI